MAEAISDEALARTMSRYAGLAARLLDDPGAWLGDEEPSADEPAVHDGGHLGRLAGAVRGRLTGDVHPGSPQWSSLPVRRRCEWWVQRISALASPLAGAPRVFGAAADRLPLQAALGAATQGLVVCAVAREHGVTDPDAWVPLLGRVLLDRELPRGDTGGAASTDDAVSRQELGDPGAADEPNPEGGHGPLRRGGRALWRLARVLLAVNGLFDERPRGALAFRALGKLPVVGIVGGVLDERGGVRRAAEETARLVTGHA